MEPPEPTSSSDHPSDKTLFTSGDLYLSAVDTARLEDEFRNLLLSHTSPFQSDELQYPTQQTTQTTNANSTDKLHLHHHSSSLTTTIREVDLIPSPAVAVLRRIAARMISAGHLRDCVQTYASVRKPAVDAALQNLGVDKLSIGDVQRLHWEALVSNIRRWIPAANTSIRVLFASERKLCKQIINHDACFIETIKGPAIHLFNFPQAISISRRSPDKLFHILDLHDTLSHLLPDINTVFQSKSSKSIRVEAAEILSRLAEAARGILSEFENSVLREPSKVAVPGGTIHPLTRYVMNYIGLISDYKQTMIELVVSKPSKNVPDIDLSEFEGQASPLSLHLIWIIVILQFNLETKSKHYKDASLAHLFMMNNVHYIFQKIKRSPGLREMIGDDYLKRLTGRFRSAATNYQRSTLVRVLHCLRDEGLHVSGSFSSGVSKSALRERFKSFNGMFEEVHRTQATWFVPDTQLREELRISISEKVIPAYRSFLGRFRSHIESGKHPENYIKYSVEDLENAVLDFFEGCPVSQHMRRRSV